MSKRLRVNLFVKYAAACRIRISESAAGCLESTMNANRAYQNPDGIAVIDVPSKGLVSESRQDRR